MARVDTGALQIGFSEIDAAQVALPKVAASEVETLSVQPLKSSPRRSEPRRSHFSLEAFYALNSLMHPSQCNRYIGSFVMRSFVFAGLAWDMGVVSFVRDLWK